MEYWETQPQALGCFFLPSLRYSNTPILQRLSEMLGIRERLEIISGIR
jgi:hypothetical protein